MYNFILILIFLIVSVSIKLINYDVERQPRILARSWGTVKKGSYTYFNLSYEGPVKLNLTSISGDVDLYVSTGELLPTYESYLLSSATCGMDIIEVPESLRPPITIGIYGYAETTDFIFDVFENINTDYPNRIWAIIDQKININRGDKTDSTKETIKSDPTIKKKQKKATSDGSAIFSLLEILQLIFL
ncbi:UPF0669 protein C6orf120 homolog [Rhynchophorus ferrugineus]|uniref:Uncharacterized protein n=1 Tax=Rhynchophorus ferrugineus TaxID=354439 RepID=A0A834HVX6_RHYFE|nr:hypothetical protein GWI33_017836 [Rhynchophorus ferrugineus]